MSIAQKIKEKHPKLKNAIVYFLSSSIHPRPRIWTRWLINPFFHRHGRGSKICLRSRMDVFPWRKFELGRKAIVEDFATVNNGAGDVLIGDQTRIGIGAVVVGPVKIGARTSLGPHVHVTGFNHTFEDGERDWNEQGLTFRPVEIGDECLIGANSSVVAGVKIGDRVQVGSNSVVTTDLPSECVAVGNPARVIKLYNRETKKWERV